MSTKFSVIVSESNTEIGNIGMSIITLSVTVREPNVKIDHCPDIIILSVVVSESDTERDSCPVSTKFSVMVKVSKILI